MNKEDRVVKFSYWHAFQYSAVQYKSHEILIKSQCLFLCIFLPFSIPTSLASLFSCPTSSGSSATMTPALSLPEHPCIAPHPHSTQRIGWPALVRASQTGVPSSRCDWRTWSGRWGWEQWACEEGWGKPRGCLKFRALWGCRAEGPAWRIDCLFRCLLVWVWWSVWVRSGRFFSKGLAKSTHLN